MVEKLINHQYIFQHLLLILQFGAFILWDKRKGLNNISWNTQKFFGKSSETCITHKINFLPGYGFLCHFGQDLAQNALRLSIRTHLAQLNCRLKVNLMFISFFKKSGCSDMCLFIWCKQLTGVYLYLVYLTVEARTGLPYFPKKITQFSLFIQYKKTCCF